jgi:hypothetical protein
MAYGKTSDADAYAKWLGRRAIWAHFDPPQVNKTWAELDARLAIDPAWGAWARAVPGRRLLISVPLLPADGSTLALGATGAYNSHFAQMAANLVANHLGNTILCFGPTNGWGLPWRMAHADDANFILYWKQIVKTMRAVPGAEKLQFDWVGADAKTSYPIEAAYPGDAYVDFVGMVLFDRCFDKSIYPIPANATDAEKLARRQKAWNTYYYPAAQNGLEAWRAVARAHKKPFSIPGWCLYADHYEDETLSTGGDNTYFIQQMHDFIQDPANNVYFASYIDACWGCTKLCPIKGQETSIYPESAAAFQKAFGLPSANQGP